MNETALLHQLTAVPLEKPCDASWEAMAGDARVRHCAQCSRDVLHLSAMSAREAEVRLLNVTGAIPCIRYARADDGTVLHQPEPRVLPPSPSRARSVLAVGTLGATLVAARAFAGDDAPEGCVAYEQPAQSDEALAQADDLERPIEAKPAAKRRPGAAPSAPAKPMPAPAPPEPRALGGKPVRPRDRPAYGTLVLKSKVNRAVKLIGIELNAPLSSYLLTPGSFVAEVTDPSGKVRRVPFTIARDKSTVIDLDKK